MFLSMIQHPRWESLDLSNVRLVMAGGGACPAVVYEAFWEKGVEFKVGYGLTEAGPNTFWLPTEHMKSKIGSVGRPLFHIDVKLVDEFGEEVGPDEVGRAIVVLRPGTSLSQSDLIDWLREQMAHYKVPKSIAFVDSLPKTAANKVDKQALIEQHGS